MKKKFSIWIGFLVFLLLIQFAGCYDFDGDGVDDEQNLCGDNFCQDWEDKKSCPADCVNPQNDALPPSNTSIAKNKFLFNIFLISSILIVLIVLGVIVYLILKKRKSNPQSAI